MESDPERFFGAVERLKEQGFAVALDDVGTAFDSREIVERGRPDYLKLDVSLVRGIDRNLIQQELLGWLVKLAQKVGAEVIAEGIESREEAAVLVRAGTHYGQGHLFAMPGPPSANLPAGRVRKILA